MRHPWFDEEDYEDNDMSVDVSNNMGEVKQEGVMTNKVGLKVKALDNDAELVLSKASGDALHYVYFRVNALEIVEVYAGPFGAETVFKEFESLIGMDEYLTYLIFQDNYIVIGGTWKDFAFASLGTKGEA